MPNPAKKKEVEKLAELFSSNNIIYATDHTGLNVLQINKLRKELKENGAFMRVAKNRLIALARAEAGLTPIDDILKGPTSLVVAVDDPVAPAKVIRSFIEDIEKPTVKALIIDDVIYDISKFDEIASLPTVEELRARVVGGIAAPLSSLVFVLSGTIRGLLVAMSAIADKRRAAA